MITKKIIPMDPLKINEQGPVAKNVFVIDDDKISHIIIAKNMELTGFAENIKAFNNVHDALVELYNCYGGLGDFPDIIFLDINMPQMNGWEFLEEYDRLPPNQLMQTKIVMLTSSNSFIDIDRARANKHIYDYMEKPISVEKLEAFIEKLAVDNEVYYKKAFR